ncbi:hypothetical protein CATMQ487_34730 [Sphaerotilus microaerophilus]|uniref:DUF2486 family protein n=1 Tax=Sphaerotilus microaerophilus TaxID=2914710 RepID=A0ABM7YPQ4_9BURK|nr:hypothetical protein CATMQ487_34730 [Sphaerotilus sp. FB-5]
MSAQVRPRIDEVPTLTEVIGFSEAAASAASAAGAVPVPPAVPVAAVDASAAAVSGASFGAAPGRGDAADLLALAPLAEADVPVEAWLAVAESQISQQVLSDVQRQVDRMFEYRVREALGPALARLTDQFVEETRRELSLTLRDIVKRAVAQELARLRLR